MEYDSTADINEQIHFERLEEDMLQARYEAESRQAARNRANGICSHGSRIARKAPAFYNEKTIAAMTEDARHDHRKTVVVDKPFEGSQSDIPEGFDLCTECFSLVTAWNFQR